MSTYTVHLADVCVCARPPIQMTYLCSFSAEDRSLSTSPAFIMPAVPSFCVPYSVCFFFLTANPLTALWVLNAMWTVYKRARARLGKDGCNMCSVMCAVIDMLTSSFQAAASKPRLTALIGFSGVCGCIRQCNLRHSVVSSLCLKMPKFLLFLLSALQISVGCSERISS